MTVYTLSAPAPGVELAGGSFLQFEAIDPTTGDAVTGVVLTDVSVYGISNTPQGQTFIEIGAPLYTPGPNA